MKLKDYGSHKASIGYLDKIVNSTDNVGVFSFTSVTSIDKSNQFENRCDIESYGPVCIDWNPNYPYRLPLGKKIENLKFFKPVIDCAPDFYIVYSEWQETEYEVLMHDYENLPSWKKQAISSGWTPDNTTKVHSEWIEDELIKLHPHRHARTLGELFKLIVEWDIVSKSPFNNEEPASIISSLILEKLNMPNDVKYELLDNFPDTHVALYLQGNPDARNRPSGVPNITPLFEAWITEKLLNYQYRGPIVF